MFYDPGSFWHVVAGEKMLASGEVIREDPFSFTRAGQPWVADQWLAECGMAVVHRFAGWDGLLLLAAALLAGIYAWIGTRLLRSGLHILPTVLLLALAMSMGAPQFHVRPLIVTIALLGVTYGWLVDVEAGSRRLRQLWWLVPLFILWTNTHGGVLGGLGTVAMCFGGWFVAGVWRTLTGRNTSSAVKQAAVLAAIMVALIATTLVSPYGLALPREWVETLAMPLPKLISEHGPLDLTDSIGLTTLALAAVYAVTLIGVFPRWPRITWLVPLGWFLLALTRVRHASLFGVVAVIGLADMLPYSRVGWWLQKRELLGQPLAPVPFRHGMAMRLLNCLLVPLVIVSALLLQASGVRAPVIGCHWAQFNPEKVPIDLLPTLKTINSSSEEGTRIFNDLGFGGFLIYNMPRLRVFVDDRCPLYGTDFLSACDHARLKDPAEIERWRREYGFPYALVETGGLFDGYLSRSAGWHLVERSPAATLYRHE